MSTPDLPFWSDDFDMDLPKVIPQGRALLGELADLELVTTGGTMHGRLNHPCCWNHELGSVSFFGRPGKLYREPGYVTSRPEVRCTLWEAVRDAWPHHLVIVFEFDPVLDTGALCEHFDAIMWHIRKWQKIDEKALAEHKTRALQAIGQCAMLVRRRIEVVDRDFSPHLDSRYPNDVMNEAPADDIDEECAHCHAHPTGVCNEHADEIPF